MQLLLVMPALGLSFSHLVIHSFIHIFKHFVSFSLLCLSCLKDVSLPFFSFLSAHDSDSRYLSAEEQSRELTRSIRREVGKLSEQWNNLIDKSDNWKHRLDEYMTVSLNVFLYFFLF